MSETTKTPDITLIGIANGSFPASDAEARALVAAIHAAAAPGVQPDAVREGLRAALEADGMTGHALEAAMRDADAVLAFALKLRTRKGGTR